MTCGADRPKSKGFFFWLQLYAIVVAVIRWLFFSNSGHIPVYLVGSVRAVQSTYFSTMKGQPSTTFICALLSLCFNLPLQLLLFIQKRDQPTSQWCTSAKFKRWFNAMLFCEWSTFLIIMVPFTDDLVIKEML